MSDTVDCCRAKMVSQCIPWEYDLDKGAINMKLPTEKQWTDEEKELKLETSKIQLLPREKDAKREAIRNAPLTAERRKDDQQDNRLSD